MKFWNDHESLAVTAKLNSGAIPHCPNKCNARDARIKRLPDGLLGRRKLATRSLRHNARQTDFCQLRVYFATRGMQPVIRF